MTNSGNYYNKYIRSLVDNMMKKPPPKTKGGYTLGKKTERNNELVARRQNNPGITLEKLGKEFDITKERVRQLLLRETKRRTLSGEAHFPPKPKASLVEHFCIQCNASITLRRWSNQGICAGCRHINTHTLVACYYCGNEVERQNRHIERSRRSFCSHSCSSRDYWRETWKR